MIKKAWVQEITLQKEDRYQVYVQLKDNYHKKYEQAAESSIGKFFAITYHGDILHLFPSKRFLLYILSFITVLCGYKHQ